jgi:hypothetical protein
MNPTHISRHHRVRVPSPMNEGSSHPRARDDEDRSHHMEVRTPENHSHYPDHQHQHYQTNVQWRPPYYRTAHWHQSHGHPPPAYHHSETIFQYPPQVPSYSESAFAAPPRSEAFAPRQRSYSPPPPNPLRRATPSSRDDFFDDTVASYHQQPQITPTVTTESILTAEPNDVLCGRGAPTNYHPGNQAFRNLVQDHQTIYLCAKRSDKPVIATKLIEIVRSRGGRFLRRVKTGGGRFGWVEVGELRAYEKVCQALREGAPEFRRQMMAHSEMSASRNKENSPNAAGGGGDHRHHFQDDPDANSHRRW